MAIIPTGRGTVGANGSAGYGGASTLTVHEGRIGNLELQTSGWVNVRSYGANGAALASAAAAASSAGVGLLIASPVTIATAVGTVSVPVRFEGGGKIITQTGGSVTLTGALLAPLTQIFDTSAGGSITFQAKVPATFPEWWGGSQALAQSAATAAAASGGMTPAYADAQSNAGHVINIDHYGLYAGGQNYGINIWNRADNNGAPTVFTGANSALVIHQYSDIAPALQIDNTRSYPFITLKNAHNESNSTGTHGTGVYIDLWGYSANAVYPTNEPIRLGQLNSFLGFISYDDSRPFTFQSQTTAPALQANQANAGVGIQVQASGSATAGVSVAQTAAGKAIDVTQSGGATAVQVTANAGAAGFFPVVVTGQDWGPKFTTASDSGNALTIEKNGTGAGLALKIQNKGTGISLIISDGTVNTFAVNASGGVTSGSLNHGGITNSPAQYSGTGVPSNSFGVDGDFYFRKDGTAVGKTLLYHRESGAWVAAIP